ANTNLIAAGLSRQIGLKVTFQTAFASVSSRRMAFGSTGNEISVDSARAIGQEFLVIDIDSPSDLSGDIQGVLGQAFLSRFDYMLDLQRKRLSFGEQGPAGTRSQFIMINGRPAVSTNLGQMVLDSGATALLITGAKLAPTLARIRILQSAG